MTDTFSKAERSRIMAAVKSTNTTPELTVRRLVHAMGYRCGLHVRSLPGTPDMVFRRQRKVIEVRGCFWHKHDCGRCRIPATNRKYWIEKIDRNVARDRKVRRELRATGWRLLVVWECQTTKRGLARLANRLKNFLCEED